MKMIKLKCPSCGAGLEVNNSLKKFTCNYCGETSFLDDETIKSVNITSKLKNRLTEIEEYYENGNYMKTYELATKLHEEYPRNEEVKFYLEKTEKIANINNAIKYANFIQGLINSGQIYMRTPVQRYNMEQNIKLHKQNYPNNQEIDRVYNWFVNSHKADKRRKSVLAWIIIILIIFYAIYMISIIYS